MCDEKCTNFLSGKVFSSIIVTIANGKAMDRLCLNAQGSLITTTWPKPYFSYFFDNKIFVFPVVLENFNPSKK